MRSAKTGWQCGQHAKHNLRVWMCQCGFNNKCLNFLLFFIRLNKLLFKILYLIIFFKIKQKRSVLIDFLMRLLI